MAFPCSVRREALVNSIRRCCVCRRYKGVGVEVHHIIPHASGGPDTLGNAIVLCFDCHTAAGHYNPDHPKGSMYSPKELREHRDQWWSQVANAGVADPAPEDLPDYYGRHLICMDYEAARELLSFDQTNLPFEFNYLEENNVAQFMRNVLEDDLPFTWAMSRTSEGNYWGSKSSFESMEAFLGAHPSFCGSDQRPITLEDFGPEGIRSKILLHCYNEGLSGDKLGRAIIYEEKCGGGGFTYYYSVRRPVFVFAHIRNTSDRPITLEALISDKRDSASLQPTQYSMRITDPIERDIAPLWLDTGQSVLIPEMVLLTDPHHDDYSTVWSEYSNLSLEQGQDFGFRNENSERSQDYYLFGSSERIHGFKASCENEIRSFPVHPFDPNKCYMMARYWHVGSCPHVFLKSTSQSWVYGGEILTDGYCFESTSELVIPTGATLLRISEVENEVSQIQSVKVNELDQLEVPVTLHRGDHLDFSIVGGDRVLIVGSYFAIVPKPVSPAHIRQKKSLLKIVQTEMNVAQTTGV